MLEKKTTGIDPAPDAPVQAAPARRRLLFMWAQFGPYHFDRCEAVAEALADQAEVVGIEVASASTHYDWAAGGAGRRFDKQTLFPGETWESAGFARRVPRLFRAVVGAGARDNFLCHYHAPEVFALALWLRLCGRRVHTMFDSKFDDRPRSIWGELFKSLLLLPYNTAFVSGARSRDYMRFLGYRPAALDVGYDTVSIARVRRLAGAPPAPDGAPFAARQFLVIARFLEKKNLLTVLAAYDAYRQTARAPRSLVLIGSGPKEEELRAEVARRNLSGVRFTGFLQEKAVAEFLGQGLALILPSTEEQWGLVVNEALAMGLPVIASDNVGARDDLLRVGVNGYVIEPDNAEGLAQLMARLAEDEAEWRRLCAGSQRLAPLGDVARFVAAVARIAGLRGPAA